MNNTNEKSQSKRPVKTAGYSFAKQRARRNTRRAEAKARLQAYYDLPTEDKINRALLRRGESRRELAHLRSKLCAERTDRSFELARKAIATA